MSSVGRFVEQHPWMTFFIAMGVLNAVVVIVKGYPTLDTLTPKPTPTPPAPLPGA